MTSRRASIASSCAQRGARWPQCPRRTCASCLRGRNGRARDRWAKQAARARKRNQCTRYRAERRRPAQTNDDRRMRRNGVAGRLRHADDVWCMLLPARIDSEGARRHSGGMSPRRADSGVRTQGVAWWMHLRCHFAVNTCQPPCRCCVGQPLDRCPRSSSQPTPAARTDRIWGRA